jgi:hypothetical protein
LLSVLALMKLTSRSIYDLRFTIHNYLTMKVH